jgi:hypothetical protein
VNKELDTYDGRPMVIPAGWSSKEIGGIVMLFTETAMGLRATFTLERYGEHDSAAPLEIGSGTYGHVVISRSDRYPGWNEMRDFIRSCGLFNRTRDVFMILPPDAEYLNLHKNAFHWYQKQ